MIRLRTPRPLALAPLLALAACAGRGPDPTLETYSRGVSRLVERLEAAAVGTLPRELFAAEVAREALEARLAPFRDAAAAGSARLRILELRFSGGDRARLELEVRLKGTTRVAGERISFQATYPVDVERRASGWTVAAVGDPVRPATLVRGEPRLVEDAAARGLDARHDTIDPVEATNICLPATHHRPGVLLADVDGDGALDVVLPGRRPRLFRNDGRGRFRDATAGSGLDTLGEMDGAGGVAADLDGDGLPELFLSNHVSPSRLLRNEGNGRFRDVTGAWGLAGLAGPYTSAVAFDADGDGRVDLFLACYGDARLTGPAYDGLNGPGSRFFRNVARDGHPFLVDETASSGLSDPGWGFAASACDADDDGDDDLYLANDFGRNSFFENRSTPGRPRFVNVAKESGTEDEGYGMGVTWGDTDGDGRWDFHVADYFAPYRWILRDRLWPMPPVPLAALARPIVARMSGRRARGDGHFRNLGGLRFEHVSAAAGVDDAGWAWGTELVDLDGKGREDLVVVNGMFQATTGVDDEVGFWNGMGRRGIDFHDGVWGTIDFGGNGMASRTPKRLFWNRGDGTFEDRAFVSGFDTTEDARGLAFGDLDGDGAPELVVACFRGPLLVYGNGWTEERGGGGRIGVLLSRRNGFNRDALGAVVRLTVGGRVQLREARAGSSYLSQSSRELLFGTGASRAAERLEVRWPGGRRDVLADVPAGSRVLWVEGEAPRIVKLGKREKLGG